MSYNLFYIYLSFKAVTDGILKIIWHFRISVLEFLILSGSST